MKVLPVMERFYGERSGFICHERIIFKHDVDIVFKDMKSFSDDYVFQDFVFLDIHPTGQCPVVVFHTASTDHSFESIEVYRFNPKEGGWEWKLIEYDIELRRFHLRSHEWEYIG